MSSSSSSSSAGGRGIAPAANAHRLQQLTRERLDFGSVEAALGGSGSGAAAAAAAATAAAAAAKAEGAPLGARLRTAAASGARRAAGLLATYLGTAARAAGPATPVTADDTVWLLDNVAFPGGPAAAATVGGLQAEFVVAVFAPCAPPAVVDAVQAVAERLRERRQREGGADPDDAARDAVLRTIEARVTPFLLQIRPGRQVTALYGGSWPLQFAPAGRNGLSSDVRALPAAAVASGAAAGVVATRAQVPAGTDGLLEMNTLAAAADGWAVVSDIDDTIKVTQTSDPVGILQTTFVDEPAPVAGMPELYAFLKTALAAGAPAATAPPPPFFYLSASPYNLYPFLRAFRRTHYPDGMLILRDAAVNSLAGLLSTLTLGTQDYKVDRMKKVHGWLPRKAVVCIGDSTQSDPEAYGEIYRTFPGWVRLILIRKVTDIAAVGIAEKNEPERFEAAFQGVPRTAWHVFEDPAECYPLVKAMLGQGA